MRSHIYLSEEKTVLDDGDIEDKAIYYYTSENEYGIPLADLTGGFVSSYIVIEYCPWCGRKLL